MEKNNVVNYSEFNKVYGPRANHLVSFVKLLDGAVQKSGAYDDVMKQLQCIGWSEDLVQTACEAAELYKEHHKHRIREEQHPTKTIASGDQTFVVCRETRYPGSEIWTRGVLTSAASIEDATEYMNVAFQEIRKVFAEATKHWWEKQGDKTALPPIIGAETLANSCRVELLDDQFNSTDYYSAMWIESCKMI